MDSMISLRVSEVARHGRQKCANYVDSHNILRKELKDTSVSISFFDKITQKLRSMVEDIEKNVIPTLKSKADYISKKLERLQDEQKRILGKCSTCLLYTSDAADE